LLTYEFCLSLWKIARCSVILLLPLYAMATQVQNILCLWNISHRGYHPHSYQSFGTVITYKKYLLYRLTVHC
jgi:hypothetical protein